MNSAEEIADAIEGNFETLKYHPLFTIWGLAYYWDSQNSGFMDEPRRTNLVSNILAQARSMGHHIAKPRIYVPKARDEFANITLLCMRNLGKVSEAFATMVGRFDLEERVNDTLLLREAAKDYIDAPSVLPETADFFDFLAHYRKGKKFLSEEAPAGQYLPLLERLMIRFELSEDMLLDLKRFIGDSLYPDLHKRQATALEARKPKISADLQRVYNLYIHSRDGSSYEPQQKLSPKRQFGKRRVKVGCGSDGNYIDLEQLAHSLRIRGQVNLDPSVLLRQKVLNTLLDYYTPLYRDDPRGVLEQIQGKIALTQNSEEARVLGQLYNIFEKSMLYEQSGMINHTMVVSSKKR